MNNQVLDLIQAIKSSKEYQEYQIELNRVKQLPELKKEIDDYRTKNFRLQTNKDTTMKDIELFEEEYTDFIQNPFVADFLSAEVGFCRLMQKINIQITAALNFE